MSVRAILVLRERDVFLREGPHALMPMGVVLTISEPVVRIFDTLANNNYWPLKLISVLASKN